MKDYHKIRVRNLMKKNNLKLLWNVKHQFFLKKNRK